LVALSAAVPKQARPYFSMKILHHCRMHMSAPDLAISHAKVTYSGGIRLTP